MKRVAMWMALCAAMVTFADTLRAEDASVAEQLSEFRARIDALERENARLRQSVVPPPELRYAALAPPLPEPAHDAPPSEAWTPSEPWAPPISDSLGYDCNECAATDAPGHVIGSDLEMSAYWKDGLEVATKHKDFRLHVGGRAQVDAGWFDADPNVQDNINHPYENGADFRRARLRIDGTMYGFLEFATEYDFVNGFQAEGIDRSMTGLTDCWVILKAITHLTHHADKQ